MKKVILVLSLIFYCFTFSYASDISLKPLEKQNIEVYFSPNGVCTEMIIAQINKASKEIKMQAYSFTSEPIAEALVNAYNRNIQIEIILDKSQITEKRSVLYYLSKNHLKIYIDSEHAIAHNKIIMIDNKIIITGSFNFTFSAEYKNAENLLIIENYNNLTEKYLENFNMHKIHSGVYETNGH